MSATVQNNHSPARLSPNLVIADPVTAYWFAQVTLRLRREIAWCWHQRAQQPDSGTGVLPPVIDAAVESLDLIRYEHQKRIFFNTDPTARYLSEEIANLQPTLQDQEQSRWHWLVEQLNLDESAQFVLALALAARVDADLGPVYATCMNDLARPFPTLALAQRLWEDPLQMVTYADPDHEVFRYGLLAGINGSANTTNWQQPLSMPAMVARQLIEPNAPLPQGCSLVHSHEHRELDHSAELLVARLRSSANQGMKVVPMLGVKGVAYSDWASAIGMQIARPAVVVDTCLTNEHSDLLALAGVCWLRGLDLILPDEWIQDDTAKIQSERLLSTRALPLCWFLPIDDDQQRRFIPADVLMPSLKIPSLTFEQRVQAFQKGLGGQAGELTPTIEECARRFRFQEQLINRVTGTFADNTVPLTAVNLFTACANEANAELSNLAQLVVSRFGPDELVLPKTQQQQFQDIQHAMQTLTVVHHHWGTARVWNECGLSVLFCGSSGTGKTMAAEALATVLNLPMFRIDLSQVVNKYIGETEKNLKRIFDAAELSECILFFDEADALFGKRTEVKDAHDRFANIEISFLLERMERFKGLVILATNRRKDLDEAFTRRLRYIIEFPVPGLEERKRIWLQVFPEGVDVSGLDFHFLAKQFQLTGGHIRSIAFNACLRSAEVDKPEAIASVTMPNLLMAVKRELEKMNRLASDELFGSYGDMLKEPVA